MDSFPARRSSDQRHDSTVATGLTALVVDDEASYRMGIASLARRVGFTADEACDAAGAFSLLANAAYDALLLNGEIAGIDPLELIARVRANERTRQTYAILLTARFDAERNIAALAAGFDDLLSKSATELEIVARLGVPAARASSSRWCPASGRSWSAAGRWRRTCWWVVSVTPSTVREEVSRLPAES